MSYWSLSSEPESPGIPTSLEIKSTEPLSTLLDRNLDLVNWNMYYGCTPRIKSKESRDLQSVLPYLFWIIVSLMWKFHIRMWKFHTTFNIYSFFSLTQLCCFQVEVTQSSLLSSSVSLLPILCPKLSKLTLTSQSPVTRNTNYHN